MKISKLLSTEIYWKRHPTNMRYYYCTFDDEYLLLRLNDFPDEPLLTVIKGIDIKDLEDKPRLWHLEDS